MTSSATLGWSAVISAVFLVATDTPSNPRSLAVALFGLRPDELGDVPAGARYLALRRQHSGRGNGRFL